MESLNIEICHQKINEITAKLKELSASDIAFDAYTIDQTRNDAYKKCILNEIENLTEKERKRIDDEFFKLGPIEDLIEDSDITEIIINGPHSIWFEKQGTLIKHADRFSNVTTYNRFIHKICQLAGTHFTLEKPMADGQVHDFRLHLISEEITKSDVKISLRRHPKSPWTIEKLLQEGALNQAQANEIENMINAKDNFIVVGGTGSGKTSLLNACLQLTKENERSVIIEDTSEICIPNDISCKLLTRHDAQSALLPITQSELLRQTLRMRPDRIVMGEMRGPEAKDFLMALSTGHGGSFATMHATDARQCLIRLEMLVQLGAPFWSIEAIRNLIFLSLQKIVVLTKDSDKKRKLKGIYRISSLESSGLLVDQLA